jgi:hypothetical protein
MTYMVPKLTLITAATHTDEELLELEASERSEHKETRMYWCSGRYGRVPRDCTDVGQCERSFTGDKLE